MAILRKMKEKLKKAVRVRSGGRKAPAKTVRPARRIVKKEELAAVKPAEKKELLGVQETAIETSKYFSYAPMRQRKVIPHDLPYRYDRDRMVLQVRDPWWLHSYWEVAQNTWTGLRDRLKDLFYSAKKVLRVYDVSNIIFNGKNAHRYFDIEVNPDAMSWYIDAGGPGRSWCVDYGLKLANGEFVTILRSNTVTSPLEAPSWITDEEWMVPEEIFGRLYGMGFGFGTSSPVGKVMQERFRRALFSGAITSPGIASMASPIKKKPKERKFWMIVDCELIVYGATEPDAKVTVQGKPIRLRPDGTFTLRYSLPDGEQVIPVRAESADEVEERVITPIVNRQTKTSQKMLKEFSRE
ncbi:MAG: DUF4912 domain-containing protein [Deltaproteobacteria bacterium]